MTEQSDRGQGEGDGAGKVDIIRAGRRLVVVDGDEGHLAREGGVAHGGLDEHRNEQVGGDEHQTDGRVDGRQVPAGCGHVAPMLGAALAEMVGVNFRHLVTIIAAHKQEKNLITQRVAHQTSPSSSRHPSCVLRCTIVITRDSSMPALPRIAVIGTGGTISGVGRDRLDFYEYGTSGRFMQVDELVAETPELARVAEIVPIRYRNVGSNEIGPDDWLALLGIIHNAVSDDPGIGGIVVTHGTATLEETAYFLNLAVKVAVPVVVVGAMRRPRRWAPTAGSTC